MKGYFVAAVVLALVLCLSPTAQATFSTDHEYMIAIQPGITWDQAAAKVVGWGDSFRLVPTVSPEDERHEGALLKGRKGESRAGGLQEDPSLHQWQLTTGEPRVYTHWAKGEPWDNSGLDSADHLALRSGPGSRSGSYARRWNDWGWDNWRWNDEAHSRHISWFIFERPRKPIGTPIPNPMWLWGSGLATIVGARLSWRNRRGARSRHASRQAV